MEKHEEQSVEYEKPVISDYGDLKELTAQNKTGSQTDVPLRDARPPVQHLQLVARPRVRGRSRIRGGAATRGRGCLVGIPSER